MTTTTPKLNKSLSSIPSKNRCFLGSANNYFFKNITKHVNRFIAIVIYIHQGTILNVVYKNKLCANKRQNEKTSRNFQREFEVSYRNADIPANELRTVANQVTWVELAYLEFLIWYLFANCVLSFMTLVLRYRYVPTYLLVYYLGTFL